jgi:hypothetical protein
MRVTPLLPALLDGPFTVARATDLGISRRVLQGQRIRRLFQSVYVSADLPDTPRLRATGALLIAPPGSFGVLSTAAYLHELPDLTRRSVRPPQIGLPPGVRRPTVRGIDWHAYGRLPSLTRVDGVPVTDPVSTFLDLAGRVPFLDAVIVGDALVRRELVTCEELEEAAAQRRGRAGLRASRAAAFVRPGVDSPMETRLRLLIVLAGLPEPVVNQDVYAASGWWLARPDLSWPSVKVSVEYDGAHHFADGDAGGRQRRSDIRRRTGMTDHGWHEVVVMSEDVHGDAYWTLRRLQRLLVERGLPGVPERLDPGWREVV